MVETVRRTAGGNVSEGPERWKRARLNAERRPTSGGAKLYRKREEFARELRQPFPHHQEQAFTVLRPVGVRHRDTRSFHVCSLACLGFQLQLEVGEPVAGNSVPELSDYRSLVAQAIGAKGEAVTFTWVPRPEQPQRYERTLTIKTLDKARLDRQVSCRVCGSSIVGDKQTVAAIAQATKDTEQYVLVNGEFVRVADLQVVDLTSRDFELLGGYSYPDARRKYVEDYGRPFNA